MATNHKMYRPPARNEGRSKEKAKTKMAAEK
jgi:hypothetical protein